MQAGTKIIRVILFSWLIAPILNQRKCRYRQAQTRSADEPMTVSFCWIFSFLMLTIPPIDLRNVRFTVCISRSLLIVDFRDSCTNCNYRWKFS